MKNLLQILKEKEDSSCHHKDTVIQSLSTRLSSISNLNQVGCIIIDNIERFVTHDYVVQPAYSPSTISEFPSTLQTTAKQLFDSPIVDFTATTHSSVVNNTLSSKKSMGTTELIELSSEEEVAIPPKPRKPPRQKAASPSESTYREPAKPSGNEHRFTQEARLTLEYAGKSRKQSDAHEGDIPAAKDKAKKAKRLAKANTVDDSLSVNESEDAKPVKKAQKKRKSTVKKSVEDDEGLSLDQRRT
jgi:hypothetical protein